MTVFELAQKYYPRLWGAERIEALVVAGRLTEAEREEIVTASEPDDLGGDGDAP